VVFDDDGNVTVTPFFVVGCRRGSRFSARANIGWFFLVFFWGGTVLGSENNNNNINGKRAYDKRREWSYYFLFVFFRRIFLPPRSFFRSQLNRHFFLSQRGGVFHVTRVSSSERLGDVPDGGTWRAYRTQDRRPWK